MTLRLRLPTRTARLSSLAPIPAALSLVALIAGVPASAQPIPEILGRDTLGVVQSDGRVALDFDLAGGPPDQVYEIWTEPAESFPVAGRWDPDSTPGVGLFHPATATFLLRTAQTTGPITRSFEFFPDGAPGTELLPLMGDWDGDGIDTAGVFNQQDGIFHLKQENSAEAPVAVTLATGFGGAGWRPLAGDWNGDGRDQPGLFDRISATFLLFDELPATSYSELPVPELPAGADPWPVAGDWTFTGSDSVGLYDPGDAIFSLLDEAIAAGDWSRTIPVEARGGLPVAGTWDGVSLRQVVPPTADGNRRPVFSQVVADPAGDGFEVYFSGPNELLPCPNGSGPCIDSFYFNRLAGEHPFDNHAWELPTSPEILGTTGALAMGVVLDGPFLDPDGVERQRLAVFVAEHNVPGEFAGWACLSFSDGDGVWTDPVFATTDPDEDPVPCANPVETPTAILAEMVSGFRLDPPAGKQRVATSGPEPGGALHFGVMNGDNPTLLEDALAGTVRTHTYRYQAEMERPWLWHLRGELPSGGMETPNTLDRWSHHYGINLDLSLDPVEEMVYWSRSYPYPFDLEGGIPCPGDGSCPSGPGLNPNRVQIYRMPVDWFFARPNIFVVPWWELVFDTGGSRGYPSEDGAGVCGDTPLTAAIQNGSTGLDVNSVTFVKDRNGWIHRDAEGKRILVFGGAAVEDRANGECDFLERSAYLWREP